MIKRDHKIHLSYSLDTLIDNALKQPGIYIMLSVFVKHYLQVENSHGWFPKENILSLIEDLYKATESNMLSQRITTLDDVFSATIPIVSFSGKTRRSLDKFRAFLWKNMYEHPLVLKHNHAGQAIIESLCTFYLESPTDKVKEFQSKGNSDLPEAIKDYVAGMTDNYAFLQAQEHNLLDEEAVELLSY